MPGAGGPFLMAAHVRTVQLPEADRRELKRRARDKGAPARVVERARIVLLAADEVPGQQIAEMVGCAEGTVVTWRARYAERGLAGLADLPRSGKPSPLPEALRDRVLERTAPTLPVRPGSPERQTFDYVRHGTTTLFAALEVATGKVTEACTDRHRHQEFLAFLKQVAAAYPRRELHVVVDNLATHKHPAVRAWLNRHPRVTLHFTPTSGSWLNLVEAFFSIITRQALRRGSFPTVADLIAAIERFIAAWNDRCRPFTWTKDPDTVIAKATDPRRRNTSTTSVTEH